MDDVTAALTAAQDGDARAFEHLVHATRRDVTRFCAYLGDGDDVDDLVQDTYLRALRAVGTYRGDASALTWLLAIARRVCADAVARRQRQRRPDPVRRRLVSDDHAGNVELHALVAGLDLNLRRAFVATQLLGLSYQEAAEVWDCPIGTIRSRVARARAQLANDLRNAERTA